MTDPLLFVPLLVLLTEDDVVFRGDEEGEAESEEEDVMDDVDVVTSDGPLLMLTTPDVDVAAADEDVDGDPNPP